MPELPADKPEVVVESREITLEDAEAAARVIRGVASTLEDRRNPLKADSKDRKFVYSVTGDATKEERYGEAYSRTYTISATKREKSEESNLVTQPDRDPYSGLRDTGLLGRSIYDPSSVQRSDVMTFTVTQREETGRLESGLGSSRPKDDLVLTVSLNGQQVGRIACDQTECSGSGADLVQSKTRDLVLGIIKPALDKEAQAKDRERAEAQKVSAAKAQEPAKKAQEF